MLISLMKNLALQENGGLQTTQSGKNAPTLKSTPDSQPKPWLRCTLTRHILLGELKLLRCYRRKNNT